MNATSLLPIAALFDAHIIRWVVWVGLMILTIALLVLIRTRWGQSQPLGKCVVLSLMVHLLLGIYISTVNIVTATVGSPEGKGIQVALVDSTGEINVDETDPARSEPWDSFAEPAPADSLEATPELSDAPAAAALPELAEPERMTPVEAPTPFVQTRPPALPPGEDAGPPEIRADEPSQNTKAPVKDAHPIEVPAAEPKAVDPVPPPEPNESAVKDSSKNGASGAGKDSPPAARPSDANSDAPPLAPIAGQPGDANKPGGQGGSGGQSKGVPEELKLRTGNHAQVAKGLGATQESEAAVMAALKWLAANQSASGRWEARRTGAGAGRADDGQDRYGAGSTADTGITGLALLAFLASGNTHLQGQHQLHVRRGLEFLLSMQDSDGNLGASRNMYEKMYCHAMATCALSEAYAMSRDERLQTAVRRAIGYTVENQDRASGGWRYGPNQPGDTSQLGWQVMALKSAALGGIPIRDDTRVGIQRFLKSVALGRASGLACYQPVRPIATRSMTAEALVCRQFLGIIDQPAALSEAGTYLLEELPGAGTTNYYYWYYATLAMYHTQGEGWTRWNEALQTTLLSTQRTTGDQAGSWDPDPVWGACGGRAYSTALGALCLEVYYRFLPLYVQAASRDSRAK